jgi:hypothetical protein
MKHRDPTRHPGILRVMQVDSELTGILTAAGFVFMGLVSVPIAKWFFLGAIPVGVLVALLFRWTKRDTPLQSIGLGSQPGQTSQASSAAPRPAAPERDRRNEGTRTPLVEESSPLGAPLKPHLCPTPA